MPNFGSRSKANLATAHPMIRYTTGMAIKYYDFTVISCFRDEELQNSLVAQGVSKTPWPTSMHNHLSTEADIVRGHATEVGVPLSLAFDFAPWFPNPPHLRWNNGHEFYHMAGLIMGETREFLADWGYRWRYGGDWDGDQSLTDQTFFDLGHLELRRL
jgi:hypothetical protein